MGSCHAATNSGARQWHVPLVPLGNRIEAWCKYTDQEKKMGGIMCRESEINGHRSAHFESDISHLLCRSLTWFHEVYTSSFIVDWIGWSVVYVTLFGHLWLVISVPWRVVAWTSWPFVVGCHQRALMQCRTGHMDSSYHSPSWSTAAFRSNGAISINLQRDVRLEGSNFIFRFKGSKFSSPQLYIYLCLKNAGIILEC